jgi:acyl-CoA synthetase (AMP-forming)/AMP-acid ligase II
MMRIAPDLQTVPDLLRGRARTDPDRPFVRFRDRSLTYGEFDARTDALASGLAELGIEPGDVVSVFLPNCVEFLEAWFAIVKAGGVLGPVNPAYTGPEASYVIDHSEAVAVVTDARGADVLAGQRAGLRGLRSMIAVEAGSGDVRLAELARPGAAVPDPGRAADDLAAILYTSGTTGKPKGAMLTHRNQLVNATQGAELVPLGTRRPRRDAAAAVPRQRPDRHHPDPDPDRLRDRDVGAVLGLRILGDRAGAGAGDAVRRPDDPRRRPARPRRARRPRRPCAT